MPPFLFDILDPATATAWVELVKSLGLGFTVAALVFIWGLSTGKIRWERDVTKCERESTEWRHAADSGTEVLEKTTGALERNSAALEKLIDRVERIEQRRT